MYPRIFGGAPGTNNVNITQQNNRIAGMFSVGLNEAVPIVKDDTPNATTGPLVSEALIPDGILATKYFQDAAITSEKIASSVAFPNPPILHTDDPAADFRPSTITHVREYMIQGIQELNYEEKVDELLASFSDTLAELPTYLPPLDTSINAIVQPEWVSESRIADESITGGDQYDATSPLPSNIRIAATPYTIGLSPATTAYTTEQMADFIAGTDASTSSIGKIARSIASMTDASFVLFSAEKQDRDRFTDSHASILSTYYGGVGSTNSLFSLNQNTLYRNTAAAFDNSLNYLYTVDASLTTFVGGNSVFSPIAVVEGKYRATDSSFSRLETHIDTSFGQILANGWVQSSALDASLTLAVATLADGPTDPSSQQIATTAYVITKLADLANSLSGSYAAFAQAVGGDASFAYRVLQESNQLDASVVYLSDKITTLERNGNDQFSLKTTSIETIGRPLSHKDISVNLIPNAMSFQTRNDACLNYLDMKYATIYEPGANRNYDASLNAISIQLENARQHQVSLTEKYDTSFSLLSDKTSGQMDDLLVIDSSLVFLLEFRENEVDSGFTQSHSVVPPRFGIMDGSLVFLGSMTDTSFSRLESLFNTTDTSLSAITTGIADISSNIYLESGKIDTSLVLLREHLGNPSISLNQVETREDESLNILIVRVLDTDISYASILSAGSSAIGARTSSLVIATTEKYQSVDSSLSSLFVEKHSRETQWDTQLLGVDASFGRQAADYGGLNQDQILRQTQLVQIDASMVATYQTQTAHLIAIDSSMVVVSGETADKMIQLDSSASIVDTTIHNLDTSVLDTTTNAMDRATAIHDSSLATASADHWVVGERLANEVLLTGATTVETADDASGTQPANTAFFKNRVNEFVGFDVPPFSNLNSLAHSLNNTGNYSQWIEAYLNEIGSQLGIFNSVVGALTTNTGGDFNYDASINYLTGKYDTYDTSAINIHNRLADWTTQIDTNMVELASRENGSSASLNALLRWDASIVAIQEGQLEHKTTIETDRQTAQERIARTDGSLNLAKNGLDTMASAIVAKKTAIADLSNNYKIHQTLLDASFQTISTKYGNQLEATDRLGVRDASFAAVSSAIESVKNELETHLRNSLDGASYYSSLNSTYNHVVLRDTSVNQVIPSAYDTSFAIFAGATDERDQSMNSLYNEIGQETANYDGVNSASIDNSGSISIVNSAGWVASARLDSGLVLPAGVRITGNTGIATASDVKTSIRDLVAGVGPALDTLGEFAAALNADTDLATTLTDSISTIDLCFNLLAADVTERIATQTGKQADQTASINAMIYPANIANTNTMYRRLYSNDASTNVVATTISNINTKTQTVGRRLVSNDASTNVVGGRIENQENTMTMRYTTIGIQEERAWNVDSSFTNLRNNASQIHNQILINDASTNLLPAAIDKRDVSANWLVARLGTPTGFRVGANSTTSLTCNYIEPVLRDAIEVNNYRITATPTYGSALVVVRDVSAGVSEVAVSGLTSGAVYDLSLAARNAYGTVVVAGVSGTTVLFPPTGLVGSANTTNSFTVSWSSGGGTITNYGFGLKNGAIDISGGVVSTATTSRTFTGLTDGTPYLFSVRSTNPYVVSADASLMYGTVFVAPTTPTFVSRTGTDLYFNVVGTTRPYVRYNISYRPLGGSVITTTDTSSNFTLTGLLTGRIYDVSVNIQNAYGTSAWSATTRNSTALAALPALSVGAISFSSIDVSFSPALTTQDCSYVLRTLPNVNQYVLAAGETFRQLTGLSTGTSYTIILDASNIYVPTITRSISATTNQIFIDNIPKALWLSNASSFMSIDANNRVSQWNDRSGNSRNATQSTDSAKPIYNATTRAIEFNGSTQGFSINLDFLASTDHMAFILTRTTSFRNIYGAANGGSGSNSLHIGFESSTRYRMNFWSNDFGPNISSNFKSDKFNLISYRWLAGSTKTIFANTLQEGNSTGAGIIASMSGGGRLGLNVVGQGFYGGSIAEVIFLTGADINDTNITTINSYMMNLISTTYPQV